MPSSGEVPGIRVKGTNPTDSYIKGFPPNREPTPLIQGAKPMTVQWKTVFIKTTIWLATEIVLNLVGLDNLADYSEFIYEQEVVGLGHLNQPVVVIQVP